MSALLGQSQLEILKQALRQAANAFMYKSSAVAEIGNRATIHMGLKEGGGAVPLSRNAGKPYNTMWPAPRFTSVPSGVFIHPAAWPH